MGCAAGRDARYEWLLQVYGNWIASNSGFVTPACPFCDIPDREAKVRLRRGLRVARLPV